MGEGRRDERTEAKSTDGRGASAARDAATRRAGAESDDRPIGVFDSGVGGLTVLRALRERLPGESLLYLGDTARVPYGTKSAESVRRYALQATQHLVARGTKALVIACNTASAVALEAVAQAHPALPVLGVVEPGARAAVELAQGGEIAVLATEGTVARRAYGDAIRRLSPAARVAEIACSLFVALAEEGWTDDAIVEAVARRYLARFLGPGAARAPDCVVLGCTHFPLVAEPMRRLLPTRTRWIDSASTTADALRKELEARGLLRLRARATAPRFLVTDDPDRFTRVGAQFLGQPIGADAVERVDL